MSKLEWDIHQTKVYCRRCEKWLYSSRKEAKKVARTINHGAVPMQVYRCRSPVTMDGWHIARELKKPQP